MLYIKAWGSYFKKKKQPNYSKMVHTHTHTHTDCIHNYIRKLHFIVTFELPESTKHKKIFFFIF